MHASMLFLLFATAAPQHPPAAAAASAPDAKAFATRLAACEAATFSHPHPLMRGFTTEHAIEGEREGACRTTQTMPGSMRMECALSDAGRKAYAAEFEAMAAGALQGSSKDPKPWQQECELVLPDGKRIPASG